MFRQSSKNAHLFKYFVEIVYIFLSHAHLSIVKSRPRAQQSSLTCALTILMNIDSVIIYILMCGAGFLHYIAQVTVNRTRK